MWMIISGGATLQKKRHWKNYKNWKIVAHVRNKEENATAGNERNCSVQNRMNELIQTWSTNKTTKRDIKKAFVVCVLCVRIDSISIFNVYHFV